MDKGIRCYWKKRRLCPRRVEDEAQNLRSKHVEGIPLNISRIVGIEIGS